MNCSMYFTVFTVEIEIILSMFRGDHILVLKMFRAISDDLIRSFAKRRFRLILRQKWL